MKRILTASFVILCALAASLAGSQKTGTLKGKIESEKGKPIAGAEVRAMRHRDRSVKETKTDESGKYTFDLEPDDYTLSFDADGYWGGNLVEMQQVEEGKETTVKTIRIERVRHRTSKIGGAVFDSNGVSLAGVHLKLTRVPTADEEKEHKHVESLAISYTTNSRGEFAFRVPATRARYQITATLSGFKPETKLVDVNESESVPLAFSLEPAKR